MLKTCARTLLWFVFLGAILSPVRADTARTPTFLVFKPGVDSIAVLRIYETRGIRVRHSVPPRVAEVEIPTGLAPLSLEGVDRAYTGRILLSDVRPLGPLALAAALQWNASFPASSGTNGMVGSQATGEVFEAPLLSRVTSGPSEIDAAWSPVDGAFFYEVQVAPDAGFSSLSIRGLTDRTLLRLPFASPQTQTLFIRVRAGERTSPDGSSTDKLGAWSAVQFLSVPPVTFTNGDKIPQLTSPVDGFQSGGFSVVLEWSGTAPVRLQVSRDAQFQSTLVDQVIDGPNFTPPSSVLHVGDSIYWRVRGWDRSLSDWSSTRHFTVTEPRPTTDDTFVNPEAPR